MLLRLSNPRRWICPADNVAGGATNNHTGVLLEQLRCQPEVSEHPTCWLMWLHATNRGCTNVERVLPSAEERRTAAERLVRLKDCYVPALVRKQRSCRHAGIASTKHEIICCVYHVGQTATSCIKFHRIFSVCIASLFSLFLH